MTAEERTTKAKNFDQKTAFCSFSATTGSVYAALMGQSSLPLPELLAPSAVESASDPSGMTLSRSIVNENLGLKVGISLTI